MKKLFFFFAVCSAFMICAEYAATRPASKALFLTVFSYSALPWAWLATVPINFLAIYGYNALLPRFGPFKMMLFFSTLTMVCNAGTASLFPLFPSLIFLQYVWKDIYVLLMLKQLWSMVHSTIEKEKAKYLYGIIYAMGTLGAIAGSFVPSHLAESLGSENILFLTLPAYLLLLFFYKSAHRYSSVEKSYLESAPPSKPMEALRLIRGSTILIAALLLVLFMQISAGLMEYQFNAYLELNILDKDLRTAYYGKAIGIINSFSLLLQFVGVFLLTRKLGVEKSHFLIPFLLGSSALLSLTYPTFGIITFSYIFLKAIDFSLFGVIREMLYIPLEIDAKFRAKAVIDVFAYRTAKALVSIILLLLQIVFGSQLLKASSYIAIIVFIGWIATVFVLFRRRGKKPLLGEL